MGLEIVANRHGLIPGTILAGGTVTAEIDLNGWGIAGLMALDSMTLGTLTFQVAEKAQADGGAYVFLRDESTPNNNYSIGPISGQFALSGVKLAPLIPYRYCKIIVSSAASGLRLALPVKA